MNQIVVQLLVAMAYLGGSALVFVFASSYYALFWTNKSWLFKVGLIGAFVPIVWFLRRGGTDSAYGLLALGFLAAAGANLLGAAAGTWLHRPLRIRDDSFKGMAIGKGLEALVVVGVILIVLAVAKIPLGVVYLSSGRIGLGLGLGLGGFVLFVVLALLQGRSLKLTIPQIRRLLPWILLFVFANAFMEELWFRALFLRPLISLLGPVLAIVLTAAAFTAVHVGATYLSRDERIRFLIVLFPLGIAWGFCLYTTESIIASTLFHAGADLMIVNGFIVALHDQGSKAETAES